jgi:hypothetical protein
MPNLTRRGLFAVGGAGAASLAVAGCGSEDDPRAEGRDGELLELAANAEAYLTSVYKSELAGSAEAGVSHQLIDASSKRVDELESLSGGPAKAELSVEDLPRGVADGQSLVISRYRDCVRFCSTTEQRSTAIQFLTQVAGEQATVRGLQNQDVSPEPFVTGQSEAPYVASDDTTSTTSTTSSSTTTSSTTTSTGG